jgi:uncharacterized membrane protein
LKTTRKHGKRIFPAATLTAIQDEIAAGETLHRAEIRLIIEPSHDMATVFSGMTSRQRALELFTLYRIWDTEENCGVLVYINLADRQVEIVADRGIARLISTDDWQAVCAIMTAGFAQDDYHNSVIAGMRQLNTLVQKHFPEGKPQSNQLSNQPILL